MVTEISAAIKSVVASEVVKVSAIELSLLVSPLVTVEEVMVYNGAVES